MKKHPFGRTVPITALVLLLLSGCEKAVDYLKANPTAVYSPCKIIQFNYQKSFLIGGTDTVRFTYNAAGDPVTALRVHPSTGEPNWFFRYDAHGRFTDLIGRYGTTDNGFTESWNRYFYDGHGRIIKDSAYFFPNEVNGQPTIDSIYRTSVEIALYEYDPKDRVSKETFIDKGFTLVSTYTYDTRGNRQTPIVVETSPTGGAPIASLTVGHGIPAQATYDNMINYHRTSNIWMFIDKDYSVNNPLTAAYDYNSYDLPVSIIPVDSTDGNFLSVSHTSYDFKNATVVYHCDDPAPGVHP